MATTTKKLRVFVSWFSSSGALDALEDVLREELDCTVRTSRLVLDELTPKTLQYLHVMGGINLSDVFVFVLGAHPDATMCLMQALSLQGDKVKALVFTQHHPSPLLQCLFDRYPNLTNVRVIDHYPDALSAVSAGECTVVDYRQATDESEHDYWVKYGGTNHAVQTLVPDWIMEQKLDHDCFEPVEF